MSQEMWAAREAGKVEETDSPPRDAREELSPADTEFKPGEIHFRLQTCINAR